MTNRDGVVSRYGSSPQAWGTPIQSGPLIAKHRFIPTGVGNTPNGQKKSKRPRGSSPQAWGTRTGSLQPNAVTGVHPHRRGEHGQRGADVDGVIGSSPQAWGTRNVTRTAGSQARFIPTGVGNTPNRTAQETLLSVHPHRRGEHLNSQKQKRCAVGSSPQAWGTLMIFSLSTWPLRFIPTGVGNTCRDSKRRTGSCGSSPQAWGTHF